MVPSFSRNAVIRGLDKVLGGIGRRDQLPLIRVVLELISESFELIDHALQNESRRGNVTLTSNDLLFDQLIECLGYSLYSYEIRFGIVATQDAMEFRNERDNL